VPTTIETQSGAFHDSLVSLTVWEASIVNQGRRTRVRLSTDSRFFVWADTGSPCWWTAEFRVGGHEFSGWVQVALDCEGDDLRGWDRLEWSYVWWEDPGPSPDPADDFG
jgi:hypothetical protein